MPDLPPPGAPAGWYSDPSAEAAPGARRWWDGSGWTQRTTEHSKTDEDPATPASTPAPHRASPLVVRGTTGYVELTGSELLYRPKADRPPLQRVPLDAIARILVSRNGDTFDVLLIGARDRRRPSLFSETSIRRSNRTPPGEWLAFLDSLSDAVAPGESVDRP